MAVFSSSTSTLDVAIRDDWGTGLVADLTLSADQAFNGWTIAFDYDGDIVNIWNAQIVSRSGNRYVIQNVDYNAIVAAGASTMFGFQGSGTSNNITPISINNAAFDGSVPPPAPNPEPTVSISDAEATEEAESLTFQITLSEAADQDVVVSYQTVAGTAVAGTDFTPTLGQLTISAGQTYATVTVALIDDAIGESTEQFQLALTGATGATIADGTGIGTITDGDGSGGTDPDPIDPDPVDPGVDDPEPFVGGGQTYHVAQTSVVTDFDPAHDVLDLGGDSIHNQIPIDTANGFMMLHMFNASNSLLLEGVFLADLHPENFAPILDSHLQQDMSAALAFEDGSGLIRPNTVYVRSHEEGLQEIVDFNPVTDKISFFYLSVRGDGGRNFAVEQTAEGVRFYNPLSGQSMTLRGITWSDLDSTHFEWRANQLEDNIAGRMGLADVINGFEYVSANVFSGKSVEMAGLVDRAPYHSQPDYTGTPVGSNDDTGGDPSTPPVAVIVSGGSVTEADPGTVHVHGDGTSHVHDDGHRFITFQVALDAPATEEISLIYATADGTAVADTTNSVAWDYHETTGTLVFAPGEQTKTVVVSVHPDTIAEDTETFTLSVNGANLTGTLQATGTIYDNDAEGAGTFTDITVYGTFHGSSGHTHGDDLHGGRTPITTEAMLAYNGLRTFLGLSDMAQDVIGQWAFANGLTNNTQPYGQDLLGVGLYYAMQGAKVGWIDDNAFDPQILADIQREARLGDPAVVMQMVETHGHTGFAVYLTQNGLVDAFVNTLKMEPHYGGWMHGRVHGGLEFPDGMGARSHDVNHLTVLSHDQTQPFMNDTFDWPQWSALNVPHADVIDYFQSMVVAGDPLGDAIPAGFTPEPAEPNTIMGGPDTDVLVPTDGPDVIIGGGGFDFVDYRAANGPMIIDLVNPSNSSPVFAEDTLIDIMGLFGAGNYTNAFTGDAGRNFFTAGSEGDTIDGRGGSDILRGLGGNDTINGGEGRDAVLGNAGDDTLTGGADRDIFWFGIGSDGQDTITDFTLGADMIGFQGDTVNQLSDLTFNTSAAGWALLEWNAGVDGVELENITVAQASVASSYIFI